MESVRQPRFTNPFRVCVFVIAVCWERTFLHFQLSARPVAIGLVFGLALVGGARDALGFEGQWHVGAGAGVVAPRGDYKTGAAAALHAAYGLSDMFDARLELRSSLHEPEGSSNRNTLSQLALGLAYKVDIIEWVPYLGVRAGYYRFGRTPVGRSERHGGMIGTLVGMDYAFSRSAAMGVELDYDTLLPEGGAFGALAHFEYRWGF